MKNVVKKCKSQIWMGGVLGTLTFETMYYFKINTTVAADVACVILGVVAFIAFHYATLQSIWAKAHQKKYEIRSKREINHLYLIQKTLNSGDKDKSRNLINQYRESKYCIIGNFLFVKGMWIGKYSETIDVINN